MCDSRQPLNGADSLLPLSPIDIPCTYCGALAGEPCNYDCLSDTEKPCPVNDDGECSADCWETGHLSEENA